MNRTLRSLLKTAVYGMDEFFDRVDRASDVLSHLSERGRKLTYRQERDTGRTVGAFAAGLGLGIAVGILLAPASGKQTRDSISGKVQDIGNQVGERFEAQKRTRPTGTEAL
jgi:hypothetical protein